jgi:hypothetical protein
MEPPPDTGVAVTKILAGSPSVLLPVTASTVGATVDCVATQLDSVTLMALSTQ